MNFQYLIVFSSSEQKSHMNFSYHDKISPLYAVVVVETFHIFDLLHWSNFNQISLERRELKFVQMKGQFVFKEKIIKKKTK